MTTAADLLPRNAGVFEKAAAKAITDTLPVPIRDVVDPHKTPAAFLPFLAAQESVDLWFEDWSESRKRAMVAEAVSLASRKGTRIGAVRFLSYVDGTMVDVIAYPAPFIMGKAAIGRTPIGLKAFVARYLVKVVTHRPVRSFVMGRAVLGSARAKTPTREPFERCLTALRVAKAPGTEVRVDFQHMRMITADDAVSVDAGFHVGQYVHRSKL